jgi:hypothetical protein
MTGLRHFAIALPSRAPGAFPAGQKAVRREDAMNDVGGYAYLPLEHVVFGRPAAEAAREEMARVGATRIFVVASKSLARNTPVVDEIAQALGSHYVGLFDGCVQHSPRTSVIEAARAVRAAAPDFILTIGGGTAIDTVKVLQICLAHGVETTEGWTACTSRSAPTASGRCRISADRRYVRWSFRLRFRAPSFPISPASPTNAFARSIRSSDRMSARAPSSSMRA